MPENPKLISKATEYICRLEFSTIYDKVAMLILIEV
jgi:hypothetical protein